MITLTEQLNRIQADILIVLKSAPQGLFTQHEIYKHRGDAMKNISENGWSFALEKLEKKHEVKFVSPCHWRLMDEETKIYLRTIEENTSQKVQP